MKHRFAYPKIPVTARSLLSTKFHFCLFHTPTRFAQKVVYSETPYHYASSQTEAPQHHTSHQCAYPPMTSAHQKSHTKHILLITISRGGSPEVSTCYKRVVPLARNTRMFETEQARKQKATMLRDCFLCLTSVKPRIGRQEMSCVGGSGMSTV
jgi:hypothetical protein